MIGLVALAVLSTAASQFVQALAARRLNQSTVQDNKNSNPGPVTVGWFAMLREPLVYLAYALLGMGLVFWLAALTELDVSQTYPLFACGFVLTMLLARFALHETVPIRGWLGAALIVVGGVICNL